MRALGRQEIWRASRSRAREVDLAARLLRREHDMRMTLAHAMRALVGSRGARLSAALLVIAPAACGRAPRPAAPRREAHLPRLPAVDDQHGAVIGVVTDSATGFPVAGAQVYFTSDTVVSGADVPDRRTNLPAATTDRGGGFTLAPLARGTFTLAARHIGYVTALRLVVVHPLRVDSVTIPLTGRARYVR
jgi:hypothetical protein